jgi:putative membrane protein
MTATFARIAIATTFLAFAITAPAQEKKSQEGKVSGADRNFVVQAAEGGMAEVELGKVAQQKGASDAVKQFGERMVADHGKANKELQSLATKLGVTVPAKLSEKHQSDMQKLSKLSGSEFDREYASHMVMDHEKTVSLFETQAKQGDTPELKAFAAKTLPVLQEHLKMARGLPGQKK